MAFVDTGSNFVDPTGTGGIDPGIMDASTLAQDPNSIPGFDPAAGGFNPAMDSGGGWLNNAANSFFGGAGMDPTTGLPYQMSPQTAQSFYTGNQLGPDQAGDSGDQTVQGQPAGQQRQAQQQQPPPWYQQMANQLRAGPGFTAIGGEAPQSTPQQQINQRFGDWSSYTSPRGIGTSTLPSEMAQRGGITPPPLAVQTAVQPPVTQVSAPPASQTYTGGRSGGDVLPTPDSPGAVPGTSIDRPGTPSPATSPDVPLPYPAPRQPGDVGTDSGPGGWSDWDPNNPNQRFGDWQRDQPGQQPSQAPGGAPGGQPQRQGGGGWLGQMLRNMGLPGPLAAMVAQAMLGGMMGNRGGFPGGFPGRMPFRGGGFPGMRGGRFGGMRGMPFRGGFPFRGMRGGYPRFQRGGFQGPGGFPFTGGDQQPDQQQSDQQQPDQTQAPGQTAATPSQVDENERIAAGQPLTPAEQAAGGQAPGTPQEAQSAAIGGAGGGNIPERVLAGARQAAMLGGPGAVARWMANNGHPRSGAWCGEFAAALMRSQNLPVPRNPAIASNWRNWGRPVRYPRPGDIAVRMGPPTGATGSHVTVVRQLSPDGRMMLTTGGNQGALTGWRSTRGYQFRTMGDTTPGVNDNATLFAHGLTGG